jgi:hypothetical protein
LGALTAQKSEKRRWLDVAARVGSPGLDNEWQTPDSAASSPGAALTYEDIPPAIQHGLWLESDRVYRAAAARSMRTRAARPARAADDAAPPYPSVKREMPLPPSSFDAGVWTKAAIEISARFREYPRIIASRVDVAADRDTRYLANTEGTRLIHGREFLAVRISASSRTDDGEELRVSESFEGQDADGLPKKDNIIAAADRIATDLTRMLDAVVAGRIVYRVYPDGRPDELLRGAELTGNPAANLMSILAAGDKREVLNLHSDGESGSVPVSLWRPRFSCRRFTSCPSRRRTRRRSCPRRQRSTRSRAADEARRRSPPDRRLRGRSMGAAV